ncbi:hypothetical protein GCM10027416_25760 [Okibacterium endophyticum]
MTKLTRPAKYASIATIAVVGFYILLTMLYVLPANPVKSALSGLTSAASPYFTQKWNVFAPNIARSNPELRIQAQWLDENGERVKSDWISMTDIELNAVEGNMLPSRIQKSSWNLQSLYLSRYNKLNDEQKAIVKDTFIERDGEGGFRAKPSAGLVDEITELGESRSRVVDLLRYDYMVKEYATYFATAYFDQEIIRVRWQVYRERPNDFDQRFDETEQHEPTTVTFGWRQADDVIRPTVLDVYKDVIDRYGDR